MSGAFGFGDDLAYFRGILGQFAQRIPEGAILVREGYPTVRYPELPLVPAMRFWVRRRDRAVDGFVYTGNLRIPTPRTFWMLVRRPVDVFVVVEFTPTSLITSIAAHVRRRKVVQLVESDPAFRGGEGGRLSRAVKRFFARRADVVLVSNESGARYVVERLGVRGDRILVGAYLTSEPRPDGPIAAVPPAEEEAVRFLFLNSLQRRKGLHLLLDALALVDPRSSRPWTLAVVGDGPEREALEEQVDRLGLGDRVRFLGRVAYEDVPAHYEHAHVVVCPTQGDYRSLAGFEAVNSARPVILSTRDGAAAEIVGSGAAAIAVDPLDAESFAEVLTTYLERDEHLVRELQRAVDRPPQFRLDAVGENLHAAVLAATARK